SVNPARSIGLAIFRDGALGDLWVFIVAPIIGGLLAWAVWKFILCDPAEAEPCSVCESAEEQ
ncbi:MAG: aquaporin, partial [Candidatus Methanomethylophilus sp.]|nr:aquaporin [Methanomethylophilus sp.]